MLTSARKCVKLRSVLKRYQMKDIFQIIEVVIQVEESTISPDLKEAIYKAVEQYLVEGLKEKEKVRTISAPDKAREMGYKVLRRFNNEYPLCRYVQQRIPVAGYKRDYTYRDDNHVLDMPLFKDDELLEEMIDNFYRDMSEEDEGMMSDLW